jgi:Cu-Zn family superoxide dismutase
LTFSSNVRLVALACLILPAASCASGETCVAQTCSAAPRAAQGTFRAKAGSTLTGTVALAQSGAEVSLIVDVQGAKPGTHGLHIHAKGDCSAADFSTAGGHFNPTGAPHGCPPTEPRHAGDFGNLDVADDGTGHVELRSSAISLAPGTTSVLGLAVILHDGADDCSSQPSGDSGMREACAVITSP